MDLSPKLLTDVQFREQWRGYNPDEVDEFLERVASGVEELQNRLAEAVERASTAERRLLERSDEDEIRRTLVLAQRTAVASMEEARAEADRLVSETEARCRQLLAETEAQAAQLDADLATRRRVELGDLVEQRDALQEDIEHLRRFLESERERVGAVLRGQLEWLDSGYALRDLPVLSGVAADPVAPAAVPATDEGDRPAPPSVDLSPQPVPPAVEDDVAPEAFRARPLAPSADDADSGVDELRLAREELADALRRAGVEPDEARRADDGGVASAAVPPLQLEPQLPRSPGFDEPAGEPTGAFDIERDEPAPAPADEPEWGGSEPVGEDVDDDPFLAELRRAVVDTEPLGPRDSEPPRRAVDHLDDDDPDAGGFFRRGRRRG